MKRSMISYLVKRQIISNKLDRSLSIIPTFPCQSRRLSVLTKPEGRHNNILDRARELIDSERTKLKADDPQIWEEAEAVLKQLARNQPQYSSSAMERVDYSIRLLDRLASILPQEQVLFASMLDTSTLNRILGLWCQGTKSLSSSSSKPKDNNKNLHRRPIFPTQMAEKIDKYRWCSLVQPDHRTFTYILDAAAFFPLKNRSNSASKSASLADELLEKLLQVSADTPSNILIDTASICIVMKAWIRTGRLDKAEEWLRRMQDLHRNHDWPELQPNAIAYTTLIHGWAQQGNATVAQDILNEQLDDFSSGNEACRPDTRTFNAVLNAWAKSNDPEALDQCKTLLAQMKELSSMDWDCAPDEYTLTSMVVCCANTAGPKQAEQMLAELKNSISVSPSIVTYNVILRSYANVGNSEDAHQLLEKVLAADSLSPDEITFNTVLFAYSKAKSRNSPQKAEALLKKMQDYDIAPSVVSFGSVLQCWTKACKHNIDGAERAEKLLHQMLSSQGLKPNIVCYNTVLNAWANVARRNPNAVERATKLLDQVLKNKIPTEATFRAMFHVLAESQVQNKDKRAQVALQLMEKCGIKPSGRDLKLIKRLTKS